MGELDEARTLVRASDKSGVRASTRAQVAVIIALANADRLADADDALYELTSRAGVASVDAHTFTCVLAAAVRGGNSERALAILENAARLSLALPDDDVVVSALALGRAHGRAGPVASAVERLGVAASAEAIIVAVDALLSSELVNNRRRAVRLLSSAHARNLQYVAACSRRGCH